MAEANEEHVQAVSSLEAALQAANEQLSSTATQREGDVAEKDVVIRQHIWIRGVSCRPLLK